MSPHPKQRTPGWHSRLEPRGIHKYPFQHHALVFRRGERDWSTQRCFLPTSPSCTRTTLIRRIRVDAAETPIPLQAVPEHIMMNVAATCFAQHDELADRTFNGEERFNHPDSNIRDTLSVLYLVRSAFALNPSAPRWVIRTTFRGKLFKIPEIKLLLDTGNLHGTAGVVPKIGGWYGAVSAPQTFPQADLAGDGEFSEVVGPAGNPLMSKVFSNRCSLPTFGTRSRLFLGRRHRPLAYPERESPTPLPVANH